MYVPSTCQNGTSPMLYIKLLSACILFLQYVTAGNIPIQQEEVLCSHQSPPEDEVIRHVRLDTDHNGHIQKRSVFENLRIHLHYDYTVSLLSYNQQQLVKSLVNEAVQYWEKTLKVRRGVLAVRLNRQCTSPLSVTYDRGHRFCDGGCAAVTKCGDILIPETHLEKCYYFDGTKFKSSMDSGQGVQDTDFLLYVAAVSTSRCSTGRTIAYAAHCQQEHLLDRPIAGYFTICPETISTRSQDHLQLLSTIKHEILHALGFTAGLFAFYRDDSGKPYTPRFTSSNLPPFNSVLGLYQWSQKIVRKVERKDWKVASGYVSHAVNLIVTPRVVDEVRKHFNCPTLEGAELENQGLIGTYLTHWEKRIFENEAMTGTYTQNPVISRITLALMEDTGWYRANYFGEQHLDWGKGLGCDFVKKSCLDWIHTQRARHGDIHPFCDTVRQGVLKTECTRNRNAVAFCNLQEFNVALPADYRYFSSLPGISSYDVSRYGGSVSLADYCPYLQEFTWKDGDRTVRDSRCAMKENNPHPSLNFYGEYFGQGSQCFNHANSWIIQHCNFLHPVSHSGSGCYSYDCDKQQGLIIYANDRSYQCLKAGQKIHISYIAYQYLHDGDIICPSCTELCDMAGFVCPPERGPYKVIGDAFLRVPCGAAKIHAFIINYFMFIVVVFFNLHMCQS
ncbi:leishmanolysin-like peptidase [Mytilus californianus]|uniref:leishmanolysin-like peptidase n=1 Tax=Mytilus californianus TaxID=6549 RepID=UPI0022468FBC|nr:leishmanolysin-like peptidase [Mytilus californianus]